MTIEVIISLISALGGVSIFEFVKWWVGRKTDARIHDAHADTEEFRALREYNDFLQQRLTEKEMRFEEQTQLVRKLNVEVIQLIRQCADKDVELAKVRCEDSACPFRRSPTAFTPPPPDMSRDEWHKERKPNT